MPLISEKINFNEIIKFSNIDPIRGIMNFFIMINYRKIRSKIKGKDNFLKILLKDIGIKNTKKYSTIIVNDIKMDFTINLSKKYLNHINNINIINKEINTNLNQPIIKLKRKNETNRDKSMEIKRNNNKFTYVRKQPSIFNSSNKDLNKTPSTSKIKLIFKKIKNTNKIITAINRIKKINNTNSHSTDKIIKKENLIENLKVRETHENISKDDNNKIINKRVPYIRKQTKKIIKLNNKDNNISLIANKTFDEIKLENKLENKNILLKDIITARPIGQLRHKNISKIYKEGLINEEIFLSPIKKEEEIYITKNRETFCEGFFIASFPEKNAQIIEKSESFPALCGHKECSSLPSTKPEIIYRYPLKDTKNLELNNLAATICFPLGIKVCYNENGPGLIDDYVTRITNQKGERYYMLTFHYYLKMENNIYSNKYEINSLKDHFRRFADDYINMTEKDMNKNKNKIEKDLEQTQNMGSRDYVFIPFCICLISRYSYIDEIKRCLKSIFYLLINKKNVKNKLLLNHLIMHLIDSVPIPQIGTVIQFYIPYNKNNEIKLKYPKLNDIQVMNMKISFLLKYFSIDLILIIIRLILFEKKILFIDDDYTLLSNVTDNFISLIYPFQWVHTYIPIMSDQMLQYLQTFLPFINGINRTLLPLVKNIYESGDMEQNEEIFLIYIKENKFRLGTSLIDGGKKKKYKYLEKNVPGFPNNLEKELKYKLKKIKEEIETYEKKNRGEYNFEEFDIKIRIVFMEIFVKMFHEVDKYLILLDDDIVFNKKYFLEKIYKEDKNFYDEFIETQLFQLFIQNYLKNEFNYFRKMVNDYHINNEKFIYDNDKTKKEKIFDMKKKYIIIPEYLNITEKNTEIIKDKINKEYIFKETKIENNKVTEYMQNIEEKNYGNNNRKIYVIPRKEIILSKKNSSIYLKNILSSSEVAKIGKKFIKVFTKYKGKHIEGDMSQKEQDELKERIKDFTIKIFKSENLELDNNNLLKQILNDINTNIGREFFVNILSKNTTNIILLKNQFFNLLGNTIFNTLFFILPLVETDKILEQAVKLIKSLKFFSKENEDDINKEIIYPKKNIISSWDINKQRIKLYPKVNQINFWIKWYFIDLIEKDDKDDKDNPDIKNKIILNLVKIMIDLELDNTFIKKTCEKLINIAFENDEGKQKEINGDIQKIISGKNKK